MDPDTERLEREQREREKRDTRVKIGIGVFLGYLLAGLLMWLRE